MFHSLIFGFSSIFQRQQQQQQGFTPSSIEEKLKQMENSREYSFNEKNLAPDNIEIPPSRLSVQQG